MTNHDIRICCIGDSFVAGTGDPEGLGWVGRVAATALACGHNLTAYNLGIRRETSGDILKRWRQECEPHTLSGAETRVVFSFGANDTALDNGRRRLTLAQSLANTRALLHEAKTRYPVLLIGPPPVADSAHDERIAELSRELAGIAQEANVPYLDVFTPLQTSALWRQEVIANDGSHPRGSGYRELAALVMSWPAWWFHQSAATAKPQTLPGHVIRVAGTDREVDACFPVMAQLRPHLARSEFVARVRRQMADGYRLAYLLEGSTVRTVAGYRVGDESRRSRGCGKALLAWLQHEARRLHCAQLHLDSGTQRKDAHRFYLREGVDLAGYHFARKLGNDHD